MCRGGEKWIMMGKMGDIENNQMLGSGNEMITGDRMNNN